MLALYGHKFSSYTWKVLIALYANATPFTFCELSADFPDHGVFVAAQGGPLGKFPVLTDGDRTMFESTSIIEYLALHHPGAAPLIPAQPDAAIATRRLDRVFDLYVMAPMVAILEERLRDAAHPDESRCAAARERLARAYGWLDRWLESYDGGAITLVECAAAPALFYADWVCPIPAEFARVRALRAQLLALPPVARCIEEARPYRPLFPGGAPDRD